MTTTTTIPVRHPDTISGLAPDCRRLLLDEYLQIQAAMQRSIPPEPKRTYISQDLGPAQAARSKAMESRSEAVASAIAEYRRVATMWGVDVG